MAGNIAVIHHALNAGEVSPRYTGRQDQNKYLAGCETLENFLPLVLGGAYVRPGTQYVSTKKVVDGHPEVRMIDFVASRSAAYVCEFGHGYIRFYFEGAPLNEDEQTITATTNTTPVVVTIAGHGYANGDSVFIDGTGLTSIDGRYWIVAGVTVNTFELEGSTAPGAVSVNGTAARLHELVSPYDSADLAELMFFQSVDVMYLTHRFYPVHKLIRTTENSFVLNEVNFDPPATIEEEPNGNDLGLGTLTLSAITGSGVTGTTQFSGWLAGDVGRQIVSGAGRATITAAGGSSVTLDIIDDFESVGPIAGSDWRVQLSPQVSLDLSPVVREVGQTTTLTTAGAVAAFRAADVGKTITIFGGSGRITAVNDPTSVNIIIRATLKDIIIANDPDPTAAWALEVTAWSAALGYPSCGCFFEERMWLCKGLTINGSRTGAFENFARGANADDAIQRILSDDDVDVIVWIKGYKTLKVATGSGIFEITATAQNGALTPSSFKASPIDPNGSSRIGPLRVGSSLIHVQDGQRELLELSYNFSDDAFKSPKLFRLADHLNDGFFFTEIHHAAQPDSFIFAVRNDGVLCACIYEAVESVIGWARVVTLGEVKSMCVIPRGTTGKDWWWIAVERDNGTFIEFFEPDHERTGREWNDLHTDSAVLAQPDANGVVSGLDHLEGQTVWVVGDGMLFNVEQDSESEITSTAVVTGGEITLDPFMEVAVAEVGLRYDATLVPVEPVVPSEAGGPFIARYYSDIGIRIRKALGLRLRAYQVMINEPSESSWLGEQLVYRKPYHPLDQQVPLQRGKKCIISMGVDPFSRIECKQAVPFPAEVMNVVGNLHVGDRWMCDTYPDSEVFFTPIEPIPPEPPEPPELCNDLSFRGQQSIVIENRFDQQSSFPPNGNLRTSWAFIDSTEEVWSLIGEASCGGGNMSYAIPCCQLNRWETPSTLTHPALIDPLNTRNAINTRIGTADQPAYCFNSLSVGGGAGLAIYWPLLSTHTDFQIPVGYSGFDILTFAVKGESVWLVGINQSVFSPQRELLEYDRSSGLLINTYTTLTAFFQTCPQLTDSFLYVLCRLVADVDDFSIKKINRSDGTVAATFSLGNISPTSIHVANDNLIYIVTSTSESAVYYVKNFNELVFVGHTPAIGISPFSSNGFFAGGSIYYGGNGLAGFTPDIYRIAIACPEAGPVVASVGRGSASVAAGASINATWADVLEPDALDQIQLRPAPTGGDLGFTGAALADELTGGLGSGSISFPIPGGTTPGTYVFVYAALNSIYVATSPTFTVT